MGENVEPRLASRHAAGHPCEIAVLVPCRNEERTIASVVRKFRKLLPAGTIYVYDNNSSDSTVEAARTAGAVVRSEPRQGKGYVVRRMFADIDADIYVLIDGDDTYEAAAVPRLIQRLLHERLDFVNGARVSQDANAYRRGHRLGNYLLTALVRNIFGRQFTDMLSGYKVFSRRFVKSFPAMSGGFEIETELVVHALGLRMPCAEEPTAYAERSADSVSKLRTYSDGARILALIADLIRNERPLQFFGAIGVALFTVAVSIDIPLVRTYFETGLVPRLPTALLSVGLLIIAVLSLLAGLILDAVATMRQEMKRLAYLSIPPAGEPR